MKKLARVVALLALFATSAMASPVLDQITNNGVTPNDFAAYSYVGLANNVGTKFVADTTSLDGAGMYFSNYRYWPVNASAVFTISIYNAQSVLLGSGSFTNAHAGWNDVFFNDVATTIGDSYFVFASADKNNAAAVTVNYVPGYDSGIYRLGTGTDPMYSYDYPSARGIDARIYTTDQRAAVPEPASLSLLGLGLAGLLTLRRKQRRH